MASAVRLLKGLLSDLTFQSVRLNAPGQGQGGTSKRDKQQGGRQSTGGTPNPDDADDRESAGSFRGTAEQDTREEDNDIEKGVGPGQTRNNDRNGQLRNSK